MFRLRKTACKNAHFVKYRYTVFTVREDAANAFVQSSSLLTAEKRNIFKIVSIFTCQKTKKGAGADPTQKYQLRLQFKF